MGHQSITVLANKVVHDAQFPPFIDTGSDTICPNNVDDMLSIWNEQDYSKTIPDRTFLD